MAKTKKQKLTQGGRRKKQYSRRLKHAKQRKKTTRRNLH